MKYAKEVIDLMGAYPGREWKMHQIINDIKKGRVICKQERNRIRFCVALVLKTLGESGQIIIIPPRELRGSGALYCWKC